jgi:hypothetical protein
MAVQRHNGQIESVIIYIYMVIILLDTKNYCL